MRRADANSEAMSSLAFAVWSLSTRGTESAHGRTHGGASAAPGMVPESTIGKRAANNLDGVLTIAFSVPPSNAIIMRPI